MTETSVTGRVIIGHPGQRCSGGEQELRRAWVILMALV